MAGVLTGHFEDDEVDTIAKVVAALRGIREAAAAAPDDVDGIAAFSELYGIITQNVLDTVDGTAERTFTDPAFLTELDLHFARRYFAAVRAWEAGDAATPACWAVLFDSRRDGFGEANFAACGVNAHINYDLAFALLETWRTHPPTDGRRADYDLVNEIFKEEMDRLREIFPTMLAQIDDDGSMLDDLGNFMSSVLVTWTRSQAWDAAYDVRRHYDETEPDGGAAYRRAHRRLERRLDAFAHLTGRWLLDLERVP